MMTLVGRLLGGLGASLLAPVLGFLSSRAATELDGFKTAVGFDTEA